MKNSVQYIWSPVRDLELEYPDDSVILKDEYLEGNCLEIFQRNTEIFPKTRKLRQIEVMRSRATIFHFYCILI
jgi:hypothetical protein